LATPRPPLRTLSLHDALPIFGLAVEPRIRHVKVPLGADALERDARQARKALVEGVLGSLLKLVQVVPCPGEQMQAQIVVQIGRLARTSARLNSTHVSISYAVL